MPILGVDDLDVRGKRVLVRVDFNLPLTADRSGVADGTRVHAALPTINKLRQSGARVILMSHLGRPKGVANPDFSLSPVAAYLGEALRSEVEFVPATVGAEAENAVSNLPHGGVLLLENTRFYPGETKNDPTLASAIAALGDIFVNDAFGTAHRAHASNVGVASCLPLSAAGYLLQRELTQLGSVTEAAAPPVVALVGGAKVSDKIGVLTNLSSKVDRILVGGAMSYTFLRALGHETGLSLVEEDRLSDALDILHLTGQKLQLPVDHVTSTAFGNVTKIQTSEFVDSDRMGLDIGPNTITTYRQEILQARTVVWNGPMGVFEIPEFAAGTNAMAQALAEATAKGANTVIGGGDSVAAIVQAGLQDSVSHVCTGGGAMLTFLEGKTLPGVAALTDR